MPNSRLHIDIIPDIHGDIDRLIRMLSHLGYGDEGSSWVHPEGRLAAFLGDFIDGGENNAAVITLVKGMVANGHAIAIMGNHELNALLFHERGENSEGNGDGFMRAHNAENVRQHQSFLSEFPIGAPRTREVLDWFMTLPLFLDLPAIRLVHAYWDNAHIETIRSRTIDARLKRHDLQELAFEKDASDFAFAIMSTLKGPETELPHGHSFTDVHGRVRTAVRLKWWQAGIHTWRNSALSVPSPAELPDAAVSENTVIRFYGADDKPVFFGHYKMLGQPTLCADNALCLDYPNRPSAYRWNGEETLLSENLITVPALVNES